MWLPLIVRTSQGQKDQVIFSSFFRSLFFVWAHFMVLFYGIIAFYGSIYYLLEFFRSLSRDKKIKSFFAVCPKGRILVVLFFRVVLSLILYFRVILKYLG